MRANPEPPPPGWEAWLQQGLELLRQQASPADEPLLGRSGELQQLLGLWEEARVGTGRAVLITGPPGVGKSCLVDELARRLQVRTLRCQAYDGLRWSPLEPLLGLAHRELGLSRWDPTGRKQAECERVLDDLGLRRAELRAAVAWFLDLPGPDPRLSGARWRRGLVLAGLLVLTRLARRQPLLLLLEDLQWADPSTLAFLAVLIRKLPRLPVLLVITSRTALLDAPQIPLGPLSPADVRTLVRRSGLGEDVAEHLAQHGSGLPLEVDQAIQNAREVPHSGRWPIRLADSVAARLERLGPLSAQVARLAACLEPGFSWEMALSAAPLWMDQGQARTELERLVRAGFLVERRGWLFHCHPQVKAEIYEGLDGASRVRQHQRIADRLRRTPWGDHRPELLALQYTRAGLGTQAIDFWQRAALRDAQRGALAEAAAQLRQAVALAGDPGTELSLRILMGTLLVATRGYADPEAEESYARALELSESHLSQFRALHGVYFYNLLRGRVFVAEKLAQRLLLASEGNPDQRMEADLAVAVSDFYFGRLEDCSWRLQRVLDHYSEERHAAHRQHYGQDPRVTALCFSAWAYSLRGRLQTARERVREAVAHARKLHHPVSKAIALHFQSIVSMVCGDAESTLRSARAGVAHSRREGVRFFEADTAIFAGWALCQAGQREAGLARMRTGLTGVRALGAEIGWPFVLSLLIDSCEGADALDLLEEARLHAESMQYFHLPMLSCLEAEKRESPELLEAAAEFARSRGLAWIELRALRAWSRLQDRPHPRLAELLSELPEAREEALR